LELRAVALPERDFAVSVVRPERFEERIAGERGTLLTDDPKDFIKDEVAVATDDTLQRVECCEHWASGNR